MYRFFLKRIIDILASIIGLPFFIFFFIPIAISIKAEDGGPVFYCAKRIGRNGIPFKMFKFRSMKIDAPDLRLEDGTTFNSKSDPRVTRVGKIIREMSLDELPQIINILLGQMSIIGPRPDLNINENFLDDISVILKVRPGITGYTQAYYRNETKWMEKIKYDKYYVDNLTFWLDLKILFRTVYIILSREKLYRK